MNTWSLLTLDIIGYASVLDTPVLPRVLAPVFRDREKTATVLLPPFTLVGDEVFNVGLSSIAEFESLIAQQKVSALEQPLSAKAGFELWVDDQAKIAYTPKAAMKQRFEEIFAKHLSGAEHELAVENFDAACEHAAIARAVNPSNIDPLVIRAAAEKRALQTARLAFTKDIARKYISPAEFDHLVAQRTGGRPPGEERGQVVMWHAALRRPTPQFA